MHENKHYVVEHVPRPSGRGLKPAAHDDFILRAASHGPVAHTVTHEKVAHLKPVIVGVAVAIAIDRYFDTDPDSDLNTDSDAELLWF